MNASAQLSFFEAGIARQQRRAAPMGSASLRKSNGQFLALRRAGKQWMENTMVALPVFLATLKAAHTDTFTFEEFRVFCTMRNMAEPHSPCAWGAVPAAACRAGLCVWTERVQPAVLAASHNRIIKVWKAL